MIIIAGLQNMTKTTGEDSCGDYSWVSSWLQSGASPRVSPAAGPALTSV